MTSTIKIYKNCKIEPSRLFSVDSIEDYLATLTDTITITKFQYIRQGLKIYIKIDKTQSALDFTASNDYKYLSIQNDTQKICYYFIMNKKQVSENTIELPLEMDTINTFKPTTDFTIYSKTTINRQHKDRFKKVIENSIDTSLNHFADSDEVIEEFLVEDKYSVLFNFAPSSIISFGFEHEDLTPTMKIQMVSVASKEIVASAFDHFSYLTLYPDGTISLQDENRDEIESINMWDIYNTYGECYFMLTYLDNEAGYFPAGYTSSTLYELLVGILVKTNKFQRIIDFNSEGLTPILYGKLENVLIDDGRDWYLVYKGSSPKCFICANNKFDTSIDKGGTIAHGDLATGRYYYIMPDGAQGQVVTLTDNNGVQVTARLNSELWAGIDKTIICYWKDGTDIKYKLYYYYNPIGAGFIENGSSETYTCASFVLTSNKTSVLVYWLTTQTQNTATIRSGTQTYITLTSTTYKNESFDTLSRDADDLIKIIKLPYKPFNSTLGMDFDGAMNMLYLDNLNIPFDYDFESDFNPLSKLIPIASLPTSNLTLLKSKVFETKLYHSDYYQPKFVYDSFSFVFALERVNLNKSIITTKFPITFSVSNTINSRFMFTFPSYIDDEKALDDYSNILCVSRNNEVTILSTDYINYLRLGYNYDVKNKARQEAGLWAGVGLSLVGSIASFASSGVTHGFGIAGGISLATTAMAQLVNAVNTTARAEDAQNQKLLQLRQQKASVYGADDVDLMSKYTGNKAKFMTYKVSERMENILYDLFFYTGYISGEKGVPNMTSRTRFNFVSCELELENLTNIPEDVIEDIKMKYSAGVTFLHKYNSTWDFQQQYENWETSLL
ncbi:MAG: hypothetical protein J6S67_13010 [Methanobrevibacter sp.]|nr:hypothetical protein [Methanobrevibacter sp.]